AIGVALAHSVSTWWRPEPPLASVLSIGGALSAGSVLALTGVLLGPAFPDEPYYGGWIPRLGHLEWYSGRLRSAGWRFRPALSRSRLRCASSSSPTPRSTCAPAPARGHRGLRHCLLSPTDTSARFCSWVSTATTSSTAIERARSPQDSTDPRSEPTAHFAGSPGVIPSPSLCSQPILATAST